MICIPIWALIVYLIVGVAVYALVKSIRNTGDKWTYLDFLICLGCGLLWFPLLIAAAPIYLKLIDYDDKFKI